MKSTNLNPSVFSNSVFEKFKAINEKISELVLDENDKLNSKTIFIIAQCSAKFFVESLSADLELKNFNNAIDFEQEKSFYEQCVNIIKSKRFIDDKVNISSAEIINRKQIQLELFS